MSWKPEIGKPALESAPFSRPVLENGWLAQATLETTLASAKQRKRRAGHKQVAKLWLRERTFALSEQAQSWMERIDRRRDALDRACLGKKGAVLTTKSYGAAQTWLLLEPAPPCQG